MGRRLLDQEDAEALEEDLFAIVGHLNRGSGLIRDPSERTGLVGLNLRAGRKAKASSAFQPALAFFEEGIGQLPDCAWTTHYGLAFALHLEQAECVYLCGDFERAERELDRLLEQARTPLEKADIYRLRIVQYENTARFPEARDLGKTGLALLGIVFPEEEGPRREWLEAEVEAIRAAIAERDIADLVELPVMSDESMRLAMRLLMTMWAPSYISGDMTLTALIAAKMVSLSLQWGNTEESAYGYVTYGAAVTIRRMDYVSSLAFGRLALAVNERFEDLGARAKVNHMFSCYIGFWRKPIATCFDYSRAAHRAGLASGDFIYAAYGVYHESWHALFDGRSLGEFFDQYRPYLEFMERTKNKSFYDAEQVILHWSLALRGRTRGPCSLDSDEFDEAGYLQTFGGVKFFASIYRIVKLQLLYLFGDYEAAARMAEAAEEVAYSTEGMIWGAWRCFYRALTLAALCPSLDSGSRVVAARELQTLLGRLRVWAENCPENFGHRYQLVLAESASVHGDSGAAMDAYEMAIREAGEHGFVQIEAIANECCARFWLRRDNQDVAAVYLRAAERCYARWGATAKLAEMRSRYPHRALHLPDAASGRHWREAIDLGTVMKAARVVSGEVEQGRSLGSLMRILLESAGAQTGFLLVEREGRLLVEAEGAIEGETRVLQGVAVGSSPDLPSTILHYSSRLGETLILSDCSRDQRFADDPYVQSRKPLSVLCMPVLHQGKPIGLLYLENNLVRDAFTRDDLELIGILASQAAISFTNVRLYEEMRQEVAERKQVEEALKRAHDQLESRIAERTGQLSRANERLEREIREREEVEVELKEAKEAAEAASRAKSEFLASMSHELRTPLNAILGYSQILRRRGDLDEVARSGVATIERSGEHLLTLINDILSLSKIEAGKQETSPSDFDLAVFLQNICDMARIRARSKGLAFRYEAGSPLPALVRGAERWLRQILLNLLSNAAKFTDRGSLTLRAAGDSPANGVVHLRFEVEDTGIGIPPEQLERIFEPFEQVHGLDRSRDGTGLGLAISKQLIQCMGGTIRVSSDPGRGSLFRIELPLSVQTGTSAAPPERPIVGYRGPIRKILIVDDKADNRSVLVGLLAPLGFELSEAADGRAALEMAAALRPDAVLLDLVMPVMDGFEAARRMRATPALSDLVILALSASVFEDDRRRSAAAGCQDFLAKPVDAGLLLEMLSEHLSLEWVYGEGPLPAGTTGEEAMGADPAGFDAEPIRFPPADKLRALRALAETGDIRAIERELDAIEATGDSYQAFVQRMREMAEEYDMQRIVDFVSSC